MKQVQIVLPYEKTEEIFSFLLDVVGIKNIIKFNADNAHLLQFRISDDQVSEAIEKLKSRGVGVEYGYIDILDLKASLPREIEENQEKTIQREATLAVEEIYENVKASTSLSFDFLAFVIFSAVIAGIGLIQNNATIIVASMLLSPLMGPMLGVALGYVVGDKDLFIKGTRNELIALGLSFAVGAIMGVILAVTEPSFAVMVDNQWTGEPLVVTEITRRGLIFSGWDVGIAVFSGAAVAISVTKGDMASLVGVAISAALMPPAICVGMMIMLGLVTGIGSSITIGLGSLVLLAMNIVLIDIFTIIMFRIKKLTPISSKSATWTAISRFRQTSQDALYHTPSPETPATAVHTPTATFTPAPSTEGTTTDVEVAESPEKSDEPES